MTIRLRVTLFGLAVVSLVLGAFCTAVYLLLAAGATATQDTALAARAEAAAATFDAGDTKLLGLVRAGDRAQVIKFVNGPENDASDALVSALTGYQQQAQHGVNTQTAHFDSVNSSSRTLMLIVALIAALVGVALAWVLIRTITRAVRQVLNAAEGIAQLRMHDLPAGLA